MRKIPAALFCVILLCFLASCAAAQTVPCPQAHLTLTVPDNWRVVPLTGAEDPGLCLLLENDDITLSVYIDDTGGLLPDSFQILTGDDTESTLVSYGGVQMTCVAGAGAEGTYRIYTWLDERDQVQFYFLITGSSRASRSLIEDIMGSVRFE